MSFLEFLVTVNTFVLFLACLPFVLFSYFGVKIVHGLWFLVISYLEPDLHFVRNTTLRTLSDTHRNKGIIAVLLTVSGPANSEAVKRYLQEVVSRVDKQGNDAFPHVKQSLVARFGTYAWKSCDFSLDRNVVLAPTNFRGRAISDINIQDCVSDIASKYLPNDVPPWQVTIIPSSEYQHYIFLKVHHVLLSEGLNIADLLPLQTAPAYSLDAKLDKAAATPLRNVFTEPVALQEFCDRFTQDCTNKWNEFISNYDPIENPELLKTVPGVLDYCCIQLVTIASVHREFTKGLKGVNRDLTSKISFLLSTWTREGRKRQVSFGTCLMATFSPLRLMRTTFKCVYKPLQWALVSLPLCIYYEAMALYTAVVLQYCDYTNTVGLLYNYVPLMYRALLEVLQIASTLIQGPRNVLEEVFASQEIIQTVTLCGRKIVAWSDPVPGAFLRQVALRADCSQMEVALAACSAGIRKYFDVIQDCAPKEISVTCRNIDSDYVFQRTKRGIENFGGVLCLDLPVGDAKSAKGPLDDLRAVKENVRRASGKQRMIYFLSLLQTKYSLLSKLFPATLVSVFLRCLSLKYSVCFTEMSNKRPPVVQKTTWGKEVTSVIYWRPPQANISISLCLNHYADEMRLAVMSDAQLAPHHPELIRHFKEDVESIAEALAAASI